MKNKMYLKKVNLKFQPGGDEGEESNDEGSNNSTGEGG